MNGDKKRYQPGWLFAWIKKSPWEYWRARRIKVISSKCEGIEKSTVYNFNPKEIIKIKSRIIIIFFFEKFWIDSTVDNIEKDYR